MAPVESIHDKLMSSADQFEAICLIELLRDVLSEAVAGTSGRDAPAHPVVGVRPQEIADWPFVRDLLHSVKLLDLVKALNRRRESTMQAEYLVLNHRGQWQIVKELCETLPDV